MAKQPGRRNSARPQSLRIAAYVLLVGGMALIATALASTATKLEAAGDGLLLIGWPLLILGGVLKGLDWMSSYTAAAEGTWDHHVNRAPGRGVADAPASRRRAPRLRLFAASDAFSDFGPVAAPAAPLVPAVPAPPPAPPPPQVVAAAPVAAAVYQPSRPEPEPEVEEARYWGRSDPGPDTVIEEFVGYEGQDRMLVVREAAAPPPPRELAWPNPPRQAVDVSAAGNEVFLGKLMDDVMAKLGTSDTAVPALASAPVAAAALAARARPGTDAAVPAGPPAAAPFVWSRQALLQADHWRFAALVEKLYQQAGFATQLQAGQTMRGVVVLWLFSRHRPGMPASVVSCVHAPGSALPPEEITALAGLVQARGLPRGQLATTGDVGDAGRQLAAVHSVHLMDTERLLQLITQRTAEQQRVLADRLA